MGPDPGQPAPAPPTGRASRLARARARLSLAIRALLHPEGLPSEAAAQLEAAFGSVGRALISGGPGRVGQVLDHPAALYDHEGVELLAARQGRSIATAMGALQLALVAAAAASTLEGGPVLALAIDGAIGQVASVVHGFCDWYNTGSYLARRLAEQGIRVDRSEVRRLTNAALMSRGKTIDQRALGRATELRLIRGWVGRGLVDALPFGSTLGRASPRAAARIDASDIPGLVTRMRAEQAS